MMIAFVECDAVALNTTGTGSPGWIMFCEQEESIPTRIIYNIPLPGQDAIVLPGRRYLYKQSILTAELQKNSVYSVDGDA